MCWPTVLLGSILVLSPPQAPASDADQPEPPATRAEQLRQLRLDKLEQVAPPTPMFIEKQLLALEDPESKRLIDTNFWGFYPRAQFISRGSNLGFGTRFWRPNIRNRQLDIHGSAFYSLSNYEFYDFQIGRIPHIGTALPLRSWKGDDVYELGNPNLKGFRRITFYGSYRYRHLPEEDFYGIGADSSVEDRTTFLQTDALFEAVAGYQITPWMVVNFRGGYIGYSIAPGRDDDHPTTHELFDELTAPGITDAPDYAPIGGQVLIDLRDEPGNPHRGVMIGVAVTHYEDLDTNRFRFDRFAFDARGFVPLGSNQRVAALRTLLFFDNPGEGAEVPFFLMESLGGSHTLRGYDSFRFRDEKVVLFQAEYRWEAAPAIELALFADAGTVADSLASLTLDDMKTNWGFGARFKTYEATLLRFDYAISEETTRFYFRLSAAF